MQKKTNKNTKVTPISKKKKPVKKQRKKAKLITVNNGDKWIEDQFAVFLTSKYRFSVKTAYIAEDMKRMNMIYRCSDTEKGQVPKEGYIYCKLWGSKKSRLYMYKGIKNKARIERRIAKEVAMLLLPLAVTGGALLGGYLMLKSSSAEKPVTETVQENTAGQEEVQDGAALETSQETVKETTEGQNAAQ